MSAMRSILKAPTLQAPSTSPSRASTPPGAARCSATKRRSLSLRKPGSEEEAVMRLGRIGFDNVAGYLQGGMEALRDRPELVKLDRITAVAWTEQLRAEPAGRTRRSHREGVDRRAHRRQPKRAAESLARAPGRNPPRQTSRRALRRRISIGNCRQPARASRTNERDGYGRRFQSLGSVEATVQTLSRKCVSTSRQSALGRTMSPLSLIFGALVGFSLGLTGGGGAIFAVPLLVYGLGVDPRQAVGVVTDYRRGDGVGGICATSCAADQLSFPLDCCSPSRAC